MNTMKVTSFLCSGNDGFLCACKKLVTKFNVSKSILHINQYCEIYDKCVADSNYCGLMLLFF